MVVDCLWGFLEFSGDLADGHFFGSEEVDDSSAHVICHQFEGVGVSDELECLQALISTYQVRSLLTISTF